MLFLYIVLGSLKDHRSPNLHGVYLMSNKYKYTRNNILLFTVYGWIVLLY